MNLQEIAQREQELRGKLNQHVCQLAIAEKEVVKHREQINLIDAALQDLAQLAAIRIEETRAIARRDPAPSAGSPPPATPAGPGEPDADAAPVPAAPASGPAVYYQPQGGVRIDAENVEMA